MNLWNRVNKTSTCWLWQGSTNGRYGQLEHGGRRYLAHRLAYEVSVGPIPTGLYLDPLCHTTLCVRPDHLEPVTAAENSRRHAALTTSCPQRHPYTTENTYISKRNQRTCKTCRRLRERARQARLRGAA